MMSVIGNVSEFEGMNEIINERDDSFRRLNDNCICIRILQQQSERRGKNKLVSSNKKKQNVRVKKKGDAEELQENG